MIREIKIVFAVILTLLCFVVDGAAQQRHKQYTLGREFNDLAIDSVDFDQNAPVLDDVEPKMYYIRKINLHGVKYLNHDILKSSAGLIEGDSVFLPSNFISNVMQRLWAPRYFSNVQIGATIEGDSVDLEVFLKERARILSWKFEGVTKSKSDDLHDVLKLKRNTELSDYIMDKNVKLIKEHFSEKGSAHVMSTYESTMTRYMSSV